MCIIPIISLLSTIVFILNTVIKFAAGADINSPQEFNEFASLQDSLKLFNESFWNSGYGTVIKALRKLDEGPAQLIHLQVLKKLYTHLVTVVKDLEMNYSTKGFTPLRINENR